MLETPGSSHHIHESGHSEEERRMLSWCRNWVRQTETPRGRVGVWFDRHRATKTRLPRGLHYLLRSARQCSTQSRKLSSFSFRIQVYRHQLPVYRWPSFRHRVSCQLSGPCHPGPGVFRGGVASWHPTVWTVAYFVLDSLFWWMKVERAVGNMDECGWMHLGSEEKTR